jgi:hypothetical protein
MNLRTLIGGALGGAALAVLAAAPTVLAKDSGSLSMDCLTSDSALQSAEGLDNTTAPAHVTVSPAILWPPNHKMRDAGVSMGLTNGLTNSSDHVDVTLTITDITDDQAADDDAGGHGCGKPTDKQGADWAPTDFSSNAVQAVGPLSSASDSVSFAPGEIKLRGERCAKDGARTYEVSVICCDTTNNVCDSDPEVIDVTVPKSRGHHHM